MVSGDNSFAFNDTLASVAVSTDIKNGQVKRKDIAKNAVNGSRPS